MKPQISAACLVLALAPTALCASESEVAKKPRYDYARIINERNGPTPKPDDNALVFYLRAAGPKIIKQPEVRKEYLRQLGVELPDESPDYFLELKNFIKTRSEEEQTASDNRQFVASVSRPWKGSEFPVLRDWLAVNASPLDMVVVGGQCEGYFAPIVLLKDERIASVSSRVPVYPVLPVFALQSRAMLRLGEGDALAGWNDLMALRRMGQHMGRGLTLPEVDHGATLDFQTCHSQMKFCQHLKMTRELAERFAHDADDPPLPDSTVAFGDVARCSVLEAIDRLQRGEFADEFPQLTDEVCDQLNALSDAGDVNWTLLRTETKTRFTTLKRILELPTYNEQCMALMKYGLRRDKLKTFSQFADFKSLNAKVLAAKTNQEKARVTIDWYSTFIDAAAYMFVEYRFMCLRAHRELRIVIAIEAYRAAKGAPPERLDSLAPDYLTSVPLDPFSEKSHGYRRAGEGYVMWGAGPDGKSDFDVEQFLIDGKRQHNDDNVIQWRN